MNASRILALVALALPMSALAQDTGTPSQEGQDQNASESPDEATESNESTDTAESSETSDDTMTEEQLEEQETAGSGNIVEDTSTTLPDAGANAREMLTDQEYEQDKVGAKGGRLDTYFRFDTEWHEYNNLDFLALDESSDQAILNSDDRDRFAFTGVSVQLGYQVDPNVRFVIGASHRGLWGNDQIGLVNRFGGFVYFSSLYAEYAPKNWGYTPVFRVGRQRFSLGGLGGTKDYILDDVLDMLRVDLPLGSIGTLTLIPINMMGASYAENDVNFINYVGQGQADVFGFNGDRMSLRTGGLLALQPVSDLDLRVYGFYTDFGAQGTGADITYNGRIGNFADNDWVVNYGARAQYKIGPITPFLAFDGSNGIDRKELVAYDVDMNGFAWSGGLTINATGGKVGFVGSAVYFEALGGLYNTDGLQYSHGYVGMKGRHVGGIIADRFMGWHPTAYAGGWNGVNDTPQEPDRKTGTRTVGAAGQILIGQYFSTTLGYWFMQDTNTTFLDQSNLDSITPPFGYSRDEFAAEERFGKVLGHEINLRFDVKATKHMNFYAYGAMLLPGAYYGIPITRVAGDALGSSDPKPAWDAGAGASLRF